ncbi:hypothetical protein SKC42_09670 [Mycobacterium sp. 050134]
MSDITISSIPVRRRRRFLGIGGSQLLLGCRGTSIWTGLISVSTVVARASWRVSPDSRLVGPNGLLNQSTKNVLKTALVADGEAGVWAGPKPLTDCTR